MHRIVITRVGVTPASFGCQALCPHGRDVRASRFTPDALAVAEFSFRWRSLFLPTSQVLAATSSYQPPKYWRLLLRSYGSL